MKTKFGIFFLILYGFFSFADKSKIKSQLESANAFARKSGAESARNLPLEELREFFPLLATAAQSPQNKKDWELTTAENLAQVAAIQAIENLAPTDPKAAEFLFRYAAAYKKHQASSFRARDFIESTPKVFSTVALNFLESKEMIEVEMAATVLIKAGNPPKKVMQSLKAILTMDGIKKASPSLLRLAESFGVELGPRILDLLSTPELLEGVKRRTSGGILNLKETTEQRMAVENIDILLNILAQKHVDKEAVIKLARRWREALNEGGFTEAAGNATEILAALTSKKNVEKKFTPKATVQNLEKLINAIERLDWPEEEIGPLRESLEREPKENLQLHLSRISRANPRFFTLLLQDIKSQSPKPFIDEVKSIGVCADFFRRLAG